MITLKLASYNAKEVITLANILDEMHHKILQHCNSQCYICRTCYLKHLCTDIISAKVYAEDAITTRAKKELDYD